jgi:hypothetical protein
MLVKNIKTGQQFELNDVKHFFIPEFPNIAVCENTCIVNTKTKHIFNPSLNANGYPYIVVGNFKVKQKSYLVHVLIATYFVNNPDPLRKIQVNHIDNDRSNYQILNLEWVTRSENALHSFRTNVDRQIYSRKIKQFDEKTNEFIKEFSSIKEACIETGTGSTQLGRVLSEKLKSVNGYIWKYSEDKTTEKNLNIKWMKITEYPDYEVSEFGDVYSIRNNKILKYDMTGEYKSIGIRFNKIYKKATVHSLVAKMFVPNLSNHPIINHLDSNKLNNHYSNLEWTTYKENSKHAVENGLINQVSVCNFTIKGEFIKCYKSILEAAEDSKIKEKMICDICNGRCISNHKMIWRHAEKCTKNEDGTYSIDKSSIRKCKSKNEICQFTIEGEFIKKFDTIESAYISTGIQHKRIRKGCKFIYSEFDKYRWRFIEDCGEKDGKYVMKQLDSTSKQVRDYIEYYNIDGILCKTSNISTKPVCQFDLSGNHVNTFGSITIAKKLFSKHIDRVCRGDAKTASGFYWRFTTDCEYLTNGKYKNLEKI